MLLFFVFFFFQAEDGIRDLTVTGVQTCALPILTDGIDAFIADYALCATWACEAGADAIEVHLAAPNPFAEPGLMVYENIPLAAQILFRVRTSVSVPVLAKLGIFRTPRALHETATKLAPWVHGFVLVHAIPRRVVDDEGNAAFEGREWVEVVGSATFPVASRQVEELLAWRKAGEIGRASCRER